MPQEFQVLQCFSCKTFQVHQVKKAKKWVCKMCGEKQSVIKVYGQGTGAECRQHVQKLNIHRGELDSLKERWQLCQPSATKQSTDLSERNDVSFSQNVQPVPCRNKWEQFVEDDCQQDELDYGENFEDERFTTDSSIFERQKKSRKRTRQSDTPVTNTLKVSKYEDFVKDQTQQEEDLYDPETCVTAQTKSSYDSHGTWGFYLDKCDRNSGIFRDNEKMSSGLSRWNKFQENEKSVDEHFYDNSLKGDDEIDYYSVNEYKSGGNVDISEQIVFKTSNWRRSYNSDDQSIPITATNNHIDTSVKDADRCCVQIDQKPFHVKHKQTEGNEGRELLPDSVNRKITKSLISKTSKWGQFLAEETELESGSSNCHENSLVDGNSNRDLKTTSQVCETTDFDVHGVSKSPNYPLQRSGCQLKIVQHESLRYNENSCNQENRLTGNEVVNWRYSLKNNVLAASGESKEHTAFGNSYAQKENICDKKQSNRMSVFSAGELTDEDLEL